MNVVEVGGAAHRKFQASYISLDNKREEKGIWLLKIAVHKINCIKKSITLLEKIMLVSDLTCNSI